MSALSLIAMIILIPLCWSSSYNSIEQELYKLQQSIDKDKKLSRPKGDQMEPGSQIFLTGHWRKWTGDRPIMVSLYFRRGLYFNATVSDLHSSWLCHVPG